MPINWKLPTTYQKLLAAIYAASPQNHNYASIAAIFGEGATYDSIEGRFRIIKRDAAKLKTEAEAEGRLTATATAAMRPRSAKKARGAGENADEAAAAGAGASASANAETCASGGEEAKEGQGSTGSSRTLGLAASASAAKKQGGRQAVLSGRVVKNKVVKRDDRKGKGRQIDRTLEGSARMPVVLDGEASDDEIFGEKDDRVMVAGSGNVGSNASGSGSASDSAGVVEPAVTLNGWGEHAKRTRLSDIGDSSMDLDAHGEEVDELDLTTEIAMGILKSEEIRSAQVKGELMGF